MGSIIPPAYSCHQRGVTLMELLIVVAIVAILAGIALPAYDYQIDKGQVRTAQADLIAASMAMENSYQRRLSYPILEVKGNKAATQADIENKLNSWSPASGRFVYYVSADTTATAYEIKADGDGRLANCTLTINNEGVRTATTACRGTSW